MAVRRKLDLAGVKLKLLHWHGLEDWRRDALAALCGTGPLAEGLAWNLAAYLWFAGRVASLGEGLERARALLLARSGERLRAELAE